MKKRCTKIACLSLVGVMVLLFVLQSCKKDEDDNTNLEMGSVNISSPTEGAVVSGVIEVIIKVGNVDAVDFVQLYINGETNEYLKDISAPFAVQWNTTGLGMGSQHHLLAKAIGKNGKTVASEFVVVEIGLPSNIPMNGLKAYFPFNGNALDFSGNDIPTVPLNVSLTTDRNGNPAAAYLFNGSSHISIESPAAFNGMSAYTVAAWVAPSSLNVKQYILTKVTPYRDIALRITDGNVPNIHFQPENYGSFLQCYGGPETVKVNEWVHITGVWSGSMLKIYVNGILKNEVDHSPYSVSWTGGSMFIGSIDGCEFFHGKIDDVLIYDRELSASEIASLASQ